MRTGNPIDGMYFMLLFVPFLLSIIAGDLLRKKVTAFLFAGNPNHHSSAIILGIVAEVLTILAGISTGFLLILLI